MNTAVGASNDPTAVMATVQAFRREVLGTRWNNRMNQSSMPDRMAVDMGATENYMSNNSLFVAGNRMASGPSPSIQHSFQDTMLGKGI